MALYEEYLEFYEENKSSIIKRESGPYISFKYKSLGVDFNSIFMRLSRGLVLNQETKEVVLVGFEKFFNVGQLSAGETYSEEFVEKFSRISPRETYELSEKLDGTLVIAGVDRGELVVATTGGVGTEHAETARKLIEESTVDFLRENPEICLLFEYIGPENKIVVDYDKTELVLLNATNKYVASLVDEATMKFIRESLNYRAPRKFKFSSEELKKFLEENGEIEGFVAINDYRNLVKMKTSQYLAQHRIRNSLEAASAETVIRALEEDVLDDFLPKFTGEKREMVERVIKDYTELKESVEAAEVLFEKMERKDFFLSKTLPEVVKHAVVAKDRVEYLIKYLKRKYKEERT